MENKIATKVLLLLAVTIAVGGLVFLTAYSSRPLVVPRTVLPMPQGDIKPPKEFIDGFHKWQSLQREAQSISDALTPAVPKGYIFVEGTESFHQQQPPVVTPGPVTSVPPPPTVPQVKKP